MARLKYIDRAVKLYALSRESILLACRGGLASGLFGEGSECFGYDDEVSEDHDLGPGFVVVCDDEDDVRRAQEAYSSIGGNTCSCRRGVFSCGSWFRNMIGTDGYVRDADFWMNVNPSRLACITNGEVFEDRDSRFVRERNLFLDGYPEDIRRKRLSSELFEMAQCGQYNYSRCLRHEEKAAAVLALNRFVEHAVSALFLLDNRFEPFYKWRIRKLREFCPICGDIEELVLSGDHAEERIEKICLHVVERLREQELTGTDDPYLEAQAYSVEKRIIDRRIRDL